MLRREGALSYEEDEERAWDMNSGSLLLVIYFFEARWVLFGEMEEKSTPFEPRVKGKRGHRTRGGEFTWGSMLRRPQRGGQI